MTEKLNNTLKDVFIATFIVLMFAAAVFAISYYSEPTPLPMHCEQGRCY